jgi:hypothetical protein
VLNAITPLKIVSKARRTAYAAGRRGAETGPNAGTFFGRSESAGNGSGAQQLVAVLWLFGQAG